MKNLKSLKKLKIPFIIFILVASLISLNKFLFIERLDANMNSMLEVQKNTEAIITIQGKQYHLSEPSNVETIAENGKNYIRVSSYIYQLNNRTLGFEIIMGFLLALFSMLIFRIYF